jgi:hypothetical protein
MRKPNFFIVGAPKCGTTSMWAWLIEHPNIFMSQLKEPNFFNADDKLGVRTQADYDDLFRDVQVHHTAIGEASVWYLSSPVAVPNILQYQPEARVIVMLRNPIEMAPALHSEMLIGGRENVRDFRMAWDLQDERRRGKRLPALSWPQRCFLYGEICSLGAQYARLVSMISRDRVLPVLFDDICENPRREYLKVLRFLSLDDDGRSEFPVYNSARRLQWPRLTRFMFLAMQAKEQVGITLNLQIAKRIYEANTIEGPRAPVSEQTRDMLRSYFASDIDLLGRLVGRELDFWKGGVSPPPPPEFRLHCEEPPL